VKNKKIISTPHILAWLSLVCVQLMFARSVLRPIDPTIPQLTIWQTDKSEEKYRLVDSHIEPYPIFEVFDEKHFQMNILPNAPITYRYDAQKNVEANTLSQLIDGLLKEIKQRKRNFSNFSIISAKNFNRRKGIGMLVVKFKEYPFILKLYIESPKTFINPFGKGLDNIWFFSMGGGTNRHIAGLTRIKNLDLVQARLDSNKELAQQFGVPRKWHWLPQKNTWLEIEARMQEKVLKTKIPAVFGIIADAIEGHNDLSLFNEKHTSIVLGLTNYLEHIIDSHIDNFMLEPKTKKIIIIDTEHFPSVVGIKEKVVFNNYIEWFSYLMNRCAKNWFFRTKKDRFLAQTVPHGNALKKI
jgi:hypothetical protein